MNDELITAEQERLAILTWLDEVSERIASVDSDSVRVAVEDDLEPLLGDFELHVVTDVVGFPALRSTALIARPAQKRSVRFGWLGANGWHTARPDEPWARAVEEDWAAFRRNWTPGRPVDAPLPPHHLCRRRDSEGQILWICATSITNIDPKQLVESAAHRATVQPDSESRPPRRSGPHIAEAGQDRERFAVLRWLDLRAPDLARTLQAPAAPVGSGSF